MGEGVSLVREPDAGDLHVRFDERRLETERMTRTEAPACRPTATPRVPPVPRQSSTLHTGIGVTTQSGNLSQFGHNRAVASDS